MGDTNSLDVKVTAYRDSTAKYRSDHGKDDLSAHLNLKALESAEDAIVQRAIRALQGEVQEELQEQNFKNMMGTMAGFDIDWSSELKDKPGTGSRAMDIISQTDIFKSGDSIKELDPNERPVSFLDFQDSLYDDEIGSRYRTILFLLPKKTVDIEKQLLLDQGKLHDAMQNKLEELGASGGKVPEEAREAVATLERETEAGIKELREAAEERIATLKSLVDDMVQKKDGDRGAWKEAIEAAWKAMGMKGVRDSVRDVRNRIKGQDFFAKSVGSHGDDRIFDRGRTSTKDPAALIGGARHNFNVKKEALLADESDQTEALEAITKLMETVEEKFVAWEPTAQALDKALRERDSAKRDGNGDEVSRLGDLIDSSLSGEQKGAADEFVDAVKALYKQLGIKGPGFKAESSGGIGTDEIDGDERDVYKTDSEVFMGKWLNTRDERTAATQIFDELGIPFTGGVSGSTADRVGGIVDALLGEDEDAEAEWPDSDEVMMVGEPAEEFTMNGAPIQEPDVRVIAAEAETCMYILGMHSAGHHSLVEMLYAAKQYPQKFFRHVRDPISDYQIYENNMAAWWEAHSPSAVLKDGAIIESAFTSVELSQLNETFPDRITADNTDGDPLTIRDLGPLLTGFAHAAVPQEYKVTADKAALDRGIISHAECIAQFTRYGEMVMAQVK